jgi:hypothetical protein
MRGLVLLVLLAASSFASDDLSAWKIECGILHSAHAFPPSAESPVPSLHWSMLTGARCTLVARGDVTPGDYELELGLVLHEFPDQEGPLYAVHGLFKNQMNVNIPVGPQTSTWSVNWCWSQREDDHPEWGCLRSAFAHFSGLMTVHFHAAVVREGSYDDQVLAHQTLKIPVASGQFLRREAFSALLRAIQTGIELSNSADNDGEGSQGQEVRDAHATGNGDGRLIIVLHGDSRGTRRWLDTLLATPLQGGDEHLHSFVWADLPAASSEEQPPGQLRSARSRAAMAALFRADACCADLDTVLAHVRQLQLQQEVPRDAIVYAVAAGSLGLGFKGLGFGV